MKVILLQDVAKVGRKGQVVNVADGYAVNSLLPAKKALIATIDAVRKHEAAERLKNTNNEAAKASIVAALKGIDDAVVSMKVKASEKGSLFAKLRASDVVSAITAQTKVTIDPSWLVGFTHIDEIGEHSIPIAYDTVKIKVLVRVEK